MLPGGAIGQGYSYDQRNLLRTNSTISTVNQILVEFVYDGDGHRVQQIDRSGSQPITTTYSNDNSGLSQVLVSDDGTTQTHNLLGLSLIHQDDGSQTRTLLADGLGSVRVEMVGSAIDSATTYEPYGKLLARSGDSGTVYGYTGEQHDGATGLVYLRARYYNPTLRLFMSEDPWAGDLTRPHSLHNWSYTENNPTNFVDPSGLARIRIWASAFIEPASITFPHVFISPRPGIDFVAQWHGDDRTFYTGGPRPSARVWHELILETHSTGKGCYIVTEIYNKADVGQTQVSNRAAMLSLPAPIITRHTQTGFSVVDINNPGRRSANWSVMGESLNVQMQAHSPNPLAPPGAPTVDYQYNLEFDLNRGILYVDGYFDWYPWHELYVEVEGIQVVSLNRTPRRGADANPFDLGRPSIHFQGALVTIPALKD
jgi:RHS repeat-associated protein